MRDKANEVGSMEVRSCPMAGMGAEFPGHAFCHENDVSFIMLYHSGAVTILILLS